VPNNFKPVQSLQRGLKLLEIISRSREGVSLKDLAREIDCSSPAAFHLVHTLVDSGFANRLENPVRYTLGQKLRHFVENQQRDRFYRFAHEGMRELGRDLPQVSAYFSEYIGGSVVVTAYLPPSLPDPIVYEERNRILPPYASAGSLAHLAFWPQEIREEYETRYPFATYGVGYWQSRARFDEAIDQLQAQRMHLMPESSPLILKLALPLFYPSGSLAAALTVQWNLAESKNLARSRKQLLTVSQYTSTTFTHKLA